VFKAGAPHALFAPLITAAGGPGRFHYWDMTRDGQRFLVETLTEQNATPLTVMVNWQSGLKK
jgi:hypothetical protein